MVHYAKFMNVNSLCLSHTGKEDLGHKYSEWVLKRSDGKCLLSSKNNRESVVSWTAVGINLKRVVFSQGSQKYN